MWQFGTDGKGCMNFVYDGVPQFSGTPCVAPTAGKWAHFLFFATAGIFIFNPLIKVAQRSHNK
jgi:hypothetical protein